ncbi:exonuclease SbcCD subunit D [Aneurinibacillus aneurinilyticus]|jgi:exonuclease SbcD|uniref:Nuclease SbcCD subunit D n=2 Tax=Aneurinibacillus aneurinilyticus TaxID=1391 RepID=A0A848CYQ7_ANEAE|nr:exonuclease SbcCD subunit D [Aneurinibacillus aneurinilyticus]ERI07642.1 exonuclease SbcCD, D subunit [Aneurinibacillus aneurinilyticus ATCC 12856]MCI1692740.1 exonuclease SbcCD subunit D [Aneurinibacillus aneurinilyticus]MED0707208.1 exonuclease SbcCD subunit D [Aneurinibacillus aneurinilyticus]MED0722055.1 exonuclease SbcCD subunit D [Aneurinibacillus aneurinilyticus]MED0732564.1 exonuclease SbcCD subunit D [Aneurinibacillus aneurinilyticus]
MKFFHTADWHLGKIIQSVYMTEDQEYILRCFIDAVREEKPDAVLIAGDLYDRAVPPTEAVELLNCTLHELVIELKTPVMAIAGNHDSPDRIEFGSSMMREQGLYISGRYTGEDNPVVLHDEHGPVHFHLVPYADPGRVRSVLDDETIRTHDDAAKAITNRIIEKMDNGARHVFVGHAFVTSSGEKEDMENASDAERPLSIGGAEYVHARYFHKFHYTALGHLHQAHHVGDETIRYAGSPLKYSISEEHHNKGFYVVEMDGQGQVHVEKRLLTPRRDMRSVRALIDELETHERSEDYVFVQLLDENPVLSAMERVRSVYPNAMHVTQNIMIAQVEEIGAEQVEKAEKDDLALFRAFYKEVKGSELTEEKERLFRDVLEEVFAKEGERV